MAVIIIVPNGIKNYSHNIITEYSTIVCIDDHNNLV